MKSVIYTNIWKEIVSKAEQENILPLSLIEHLKKWTVENLDYDENFEDIHDEDSLIGIHYLEIKEDSTNNEVTEINRVDYILHNRPYRWGHTFEIEEDLFDNIIEKEYELDIDQVIFFTDKLNELICLIEEEQNKHVFN